ncbi:MAG: hypothetical protein J5825_11315 [Lachnospiraceae bacterium]|nr:hypothetical protein [Lachnospiraceae bacterium]
MSLFRKKREPKVWLWAQDLYLGAGVNGRLGEIVSEIRNCNYHGEKDRFERLLYYMDGLLRAETGDGLPKWNDDGSEEYYILTLSQDPSDRLDLYPAHALLQDAFISRRIRIVGLAGGYRDALNLTAKIMLDYENRDRSEEEEEITFPEFFTFGSCPIRDLK